MNKKYFKWIKTVVLSGFIGLSLVHAEIAYNEQIISGNTELSLSIGGKAVSMDGEWLAVGAYDEANTDSCFVTMFRFNYTTKQWVEHSTLGDNGGNCISNKGFGSAISLSGTEMVVGLANYAQNGGSNNNGGAFSAYWFDGTDWIQIFDRIRPREADGTLDIQVLGGFGLAVNIQNGILVVGSPKYDTTAGVDAGKIYIYERPDPFSPPYDTLTPTVTVEGDQAGSFFGNAVAGDKEDILVGAPFYDYNGSTDAGAGFLYEYNYTSEPPTIAPTPTTVYGTETNESIGLHLEHAHTHDHDHEHPFAVIAGNIDSHGYHYTVDQGWQLQYTENNASGGDVDIKTNIGAIARKGESIKIFPLFESSLGTYSFNLVPSGPIGSDFAEDISFLHNKVAVSEFAEKQARFYTIPCGYGGELAKNVWFMVSIPCKITGQTVASIFGDDGLGTYGANWVVYEQNTSNYSGESIDYIKLDTNSSIEQGKSYWIIADANKVWKVDSNASSTHTDLDTNSSLIIDPDVIAGTYAIPLPQADQNLSGAAYAKVMVGNPFARSFEWTNVQYYSETDGNISLASAEASNYMNSTAYMYDSSITSGQPYFAVTRTPGVGSKTIIVNDGFWIKVLAGAQSGDKLLIPLEK